MKIFSVSESDLEKMNISHTTWKNIISLVVCIVLLVLFLGIRRRWLGPATAYPKNNSKNPISEENDTVEGFVGAQRPVRKDVKVIYDRFYASIYDQLFHMGEKNKYELQELQGYFLSQYKNRDRVSILDLGCGTGYHLKELSRSYKNTTGVDQSQAMVDIAKKNSPDSHLVCADFMSQSLFPPDSFTHILSYYFTIYYVKDKTTLASYVKQWLRPGGIWAVHVVNRSKFDPLLDRVSPYPAFSLQKYSTNRITQSRLHFNNFSYQGRFKMIEKTTIDLMEDKGKNGVKSRFDDVTEFQESFQFKKKGKQTRRQIHTLYMPRIKQVIKEIETSGLRYLGNSNLLNGGCEYQYILYFKKDRPKGISRDGSIKGLDDVVDKNKQIIRPVNDEDKNLATF